MGGWQGRWDGGRVQGLVVGSYGVIGTSWFAKGSSMRGRGFDSGRPGYRPFGPGALGPNEPRGSWAEKLEGWQAWWVDLGSRHWASVVVG